MCPLTFDDIAQKIEKKRYSNGGCALQEDQNLSAWEDGWYENGRKEWCNGKECVRGDNRWLWWTGFKIIQKLYLCQPKNSEVDTLISYNNL